MTIAATSIKLEPELKARVQRLAQARDRTPHWVLRAAIERFVDQEESRESFRADALAAWSEYQVTGLHVTAAEADAWMAELEAGDAVDLPKCHS